jgi:hypothetical protein
MLLTSMPRPAGGDGLVCAGLLAPVAVMVSSKLKIESNNFLFIDSAPDNCQQLRFQAIKHTREGNRLADMFDAAEPPRASLDTHAEPSVRKRAVLAKIQIPVERILR